MLVLRRIYVVVEGMAVAGGKVVVDKAIKGLIVIEVVVYISVLRSGF